MYLVNSLIDMYSCSELSVGRLLLHNKVLIIKNIFEIKIVFDIFNKYYLCIIYFWCNLDGINQQNRTVNESELLVTMINWLFYTFYS